MGIGVGMVVDGATAFGQSAPTAEWLPPVTFGAVLVLLPQGVVIASWAGEDPREADGFTLSHWAAVAGFGLWSLFAVAYLVLGYASVVVWGNVAFGVGGLALVLREWRRRS